MSSSGGPLRTDGTAAGSRNGPAPPVQTAEGESPSRCRRCATASSASSADHPDTRPSCARDRWRRSSSGLRAGLSDRDIESLAAKPASGPSARRPSRRLPELRERYRPSGPQPRRGAPARAHARRHLPADPARGPRRACSWPGASRPRASACCSMSASASASGSRTGSTWGANSAPRPARPLLVVSDGHLASSAPSVSCGPMPIARDARASTAQHPRQAAPTPAAHERVRAAYWAALDEATDPEEARAACARSWASSR